MLKLLPTLKVLSLATDIQSKKSNIEINNVNKLEPLEWLDSQREIYWYYICVIDTDVGNQLLITVYTELIMFPNWLVNDNFRWLDLVNHTFKSITELYRFFLNFRKTEQKV